MLFAIAMFLTLLGAVGYLYVQVMLDSEGGVPLTRSARVAVAVALPFMLAQVVYAVYRARSKNKWRNVRVLMGRAWGFVVGTRETLGW